MLKKRYMVIFTGGNQLCHRSAFGKLTESSHVIVENNKMAPRSNSGLLVVLLLTFMVLTYAGRPTPRFSSNTVQFQARFQGSDHGVEQLDGEESCEGIPEQDCLMRRTLIAHTDYIYTQNQNP
ncbi:Phytosulfokines 3 [Bienertia sinuspersici]